MKTATLTEAKNRFGSLIDLVRGGETITILDRGVPVARLEPVAALPAQVGVGSVSSVPGSPGGDRLHRLSTSSGAPRRR